MGTAVPATLPGILGLDQAGGMPLLGANRIGVATRSAGVHDMPARFSLNPGGSTGGSRRRIQVKQIMTAGFVTKAILKKLLPEMIKAPLRSYVYSKRFLYSQAGQDLWVLGEVFDEKRNGFFLDIGAYDGVNLSNTYVLEKRYGWKGICIEADPDSFEQLKRNRTATCVNLCLDDKDGFVKFAKRGVLSGIVSETTDNNSSDPCDIVTINTVTLGHVLDDMNAPTEIDYLSIDIEGAEERVLKDFSFTKYKIKCITIERPTDLLMDILSRNGFVLIKEIPGLDCFYLHKDLIDRHVANICSFYDKALIAFRMG